MNSRFPNALKLSLATLLVGGVYVLQNAEHYATKIIDTALPGAEDAAHWLTIASEYTGLTEWNTAQRTWLEKWIALGNGETEEDETYHSEDEVDTEEPEPPVTPPEEPEPATPQPPQPGPVEPVAEPLAQETIIPSDDETDPQPAPGHDAPEPPAPLLDTEASPFTTAEPLPWPPAPQQMEPSMVDVIQPTPPPAPPLKDVSEPDSAPTPIPGAEQPLADTDNTDATTEPTPPVEIPKQAPPVRCKVVLMGDSLMEDLGPRTHRRLNHRKGLQFILSAKYSTGLCRSDFFDWPAHMREVLAEHKPDFLVVFIGANDGQPIKHGNTYVPTGGSQWSEVYGQKMQEIIDIAKEHGTKVIWIGLPVMGKYMRLLAETTRTQKEYCTRTGIPYVDSNETFADANGGFMAFRKDANGKIMRLRRQDKVHLSPEGNHALINQLVPVLEKNLAEFSVTHPERCLTDEEAKKTAPAPLVVTVKYKPSTHRESTRKKKRKNK